jgi:class 3 adenylate cyclase
MRWARRATACSSRLPGSRTPFTGPRTRSARSKVTPGPPRLGPVRIRIGLHTGEPFVSHEAGGRVNYYGAPVNRAARIEAAAHGGQVLVSQATHDLFRDPSPTARAASPSWTGGRTG